jgi:hypothetical protein
VLRPFVGLALFLSNEPIFGGLRGDPGDLDLSGDGRRNVAFGLAGGLKALEFVERPAQASLYGGFVAGLL